MSLTLSLIVAIVIALAGGLLVGLLVPGIPERWKTLAAVVSSLFLVAVVVVPVLIREGHRAQRKTDSAAVKADGTSGRIGSREAEPDTSRYPFAVLYPRNGDRVGRTVDVNGTTPYRNFNHYVVLTTTEGDNWVEGDRVTVRPAGSWECLMTFASPNAGIGQQFQMWCLATHEVLQRGRLLAEPDDSKRSEPVTVTRGE
jgi:hypothetical protein